MLYPQNSDCTVTIDSATSLHFTSLHCIVGAQKQIEMIGTESSHAKAAGLSALNRCYNCLHVRMREQVPTAGGRNIIIAFSVDA